MEKTTNPYCLRDHANAHQWWEWGYDNGNLKHVIYLPPKRSRPDYCAAWEAGVAASIKDRMNAEAEEARKKYESTGVHPNQAAMNELLLEREQRHFVPALDAVLDAVLRETAERAQRLETEVLAGVLGASKIKKSTTFREAAEEIQRGDPEREYIDPNAGMYANFVPSGNIGDVNSKERGTGARFNAGKAKLQYVPMGVLRRVVNPEQGSALYMTALQIESFESRQSDHGAALALAHVPEEHRWASTGEQFDFGAKKYAAWNWAKGMPWSVSLACFKRHWLALARGEEIDPESGVSHWGAIGCNLVMLIHYVDNYREGDDRPPAEIFLPRRNPTP